MTCEFLSRPELEAIPRSRVGRSRATLVRTAWLGLYLVGCQAEQSRPTAAALGVTEIELSTPSCPATDLGALTVDTLAVGLEAPWDVAFLADGRALITERPGRIRVWTPEDGLLPEPWLELDVYSDAEAGLLGIDVEPGGETVFVAGTFQTLGTNRITRAGRGVWRRLIRRVSPERGHAVWLRVLRLEEQDGGGVTVTPIVEGIPSASVHAGGAVRFGPEGLLYVSTGDAAAPWTAQEEGTARGKILRFDVDGSVPIGNPREDSPIYASGIRNAQGLAWYSSTGDLLAIDHGPTGLEREGFRTDLDELNVVVPGANFGWPIVAGATRGGALVSPIAEWTTALAPASLATLSGQSAWSGSAFVTGLRGASLDRLALEETADGLAVSCRESLFHTEYGRLRMIRAAPDGSLWFGTSNRDHRGTPREGSDLILRLHAPGAQ